MKNKVPLYLGAKKLDAAQRADRQAVVHDVLRPMSLEDALSCVMAHIEARPDIERNAVALEKFSHNCGRLAWKYL